MNFLILFRITLSVVLSLGFVLSNPISVLAAGPFGTHYAGTYYPIYNSGVGQYIPPETSMPFDKVSTIFVAFAHAYQDGKQAAELRLQEDQPDEANRLSLLTKVAREVNPDVKILISLGWGMNDWTYISQDYNRENRFPASVVDLIRQYGLDGFDIDDESIGGSSGSISQNDFNGVIQNIRDALDRASRKDGKPYYLTITPAFGNAQVSQKNVHNFDLINVQCYGETDYTLCSGKAFPDITSLGYPKDKIAWGIRAKSGCPWPSSSELEGLAGIFDWTMSRDSASNPPYKFTKEIAKKVGYSR